MAAVRDLLSSLNSLAQSGLLASGWLRTADQGAGPADAGSGVAACEPPQGPYTAGGVEPPLDEVLDDPVIHLMMRADRLEPEQVRCLLMAGRRQQEP
jgi:hypothetical protein